MNSDKTGCKELIMINEKLLKIEGFVQTENTKLFL